MRELFPSYSCRMDAGGGIRDFVGGIPLFGSGTPSTLSAAPLSLHLCLHLGICLCLCLLYGLSSSNPLPLRLRGTLYIPWC